MQTWLAPDPGFRTHDHALACFVSWAAAATAVVHQPLFLPDFPEHGDPAGVYAIFVRQAAEFNIRLLLSPLARHDPPALTASRNSFPALNVGAVEAPMFRLLPVLGIRPVRTGRPLVPKVAKLTTRTSSPPAQGVSDHLEHGIIASPAADFASPVRSATWPAISNLFTRYLPALLRTPNARFSRRTIADSGAHGWHETPAGSVPAAAMLRSAPVRAPPPAFRTACTRRAASGG